MIPLFSVGTICIGGTWFAVSAAGTYTVNDVVKTPGDWSSDYEDESDGKPQPNLILFPLLITVSNSVGLYGNPEVFQGTLSRAAGYPEINFVKVGYTQDWDDCSIAIRAQQIGVFVGNDSFEHEANSDPPYDWARFTGVWERFTPQTGHDPNVALNITEGNLLA